MSEDASIVHVEGNLVTSFQDSGNLDVIRKYSTFLDDIHKESEALYKKMGAVGLLPDRIKSPSDMIVPFYWGTLKLGLDPAIAVSHVSNINKKVTVETIVFQAILATKCPGSYYEIVESTESKARVIGHRPPRPPQTMEFTFNEGVNGAQTNMVWNKHKRSMTLTKCLRLLMKSYWPEIFIGIEPVPEGLSQKEKEAYIASEFLEESQVASTQIPSIPKISEIEPVSNVSEPEETVKEKTRKEKESELKNLVAEIGKRKGVPSGTNGNSFAVPLLSNVSKALGLTFTGKISTMEDEDFNLLYDAMQSSETIQAIESSIEWKDGALSVTEATE